jgi:hypothetical protein
MLYGRRILAQMRNPSHETGAEQNKKQAVDCVGCVFQRVAY